MKSSHPQKRWHPNTFYITTLCIASVVSLAIAVYISALIFWQGLGIEREVFWKSTEKINQGVLVSPRYVPVAGSNSLVRSGYNSTPITERQLEWKQTSVVKSYEGFHPVIFLLSGISTIIWIASGIFLKQKSLRTGSAAIAKQLNSRLLQDNPTILPEEKQLLDLVREMAIAARVRVPQVYLLDAENGINAFTAGCNVKDVSIGVTRGCLDRLTCAELQAVIAHQLTRPLHENLRLNLYLVAVLHGMFVIYLTGQRLINWGRDFYCQIDIPVYRVLLSIARIPTVLFGLLLMNLGSLGHVWGRIIQKEICYRQSLLGDISAAQLTKHPEGLADVLEKFQNNVSLSRIKSPYGAEMGHLFFVDARAASWLGNGFPTHPPIKQRLRRLEFYRRRYISQHQKPSPTQELPTNSVNDNQPN